MTEHMVTECLILAIAGPPLVYVAAWIASKAFFHAKFDYNRRLSKALMEGDRYDD